MFKLDISYLVNYISYLVNYMQVGRYPTPLFGYFLLSTLHASWSLPPFLLSFPIPGIHKLLFLYIIPSDPFSKCTVFFFFMFIVDFFCFVHPANTLLKNDFRFRHTVSEGFMLTCPPQNQIFKIWGLYILDCCEKSQENW